MDPSKDVSSYRYLNDLPNLTPASLNNALQILERLACLGFHTALNEIASLGVDAKASGNEHKGWAHDALTIWPKWLRCICSHDLTADIPAQKLAARITSKEGY